MKKILSVLLSPYSGDENKARKEFILNVLLVSSIALFCLAIPISLIASLVHPGPVAHDTVPVGILAAMLVFFSMLYTLSRKGFSGSSAHMLVITFFLFAFFMERRWGVDLNASLLIYALAIVMAGILVSTRFAFIVTGVVAITITGLAYMQASHLIIVDSYWRTETWEDGDTVMTIIIFLVIAIVSWLSNREIERSLARAHASERDLRTERDMLEVTVLERTRKLKEAQIEKVAQLYRFAEFGRLSSGLFHDLMNPLSAVSLNLEKAHTPEGGSHDILNAEKYISQAFVAAKRMERFIAAVRKQISKTEKKQQFRVKEEVGEVLEILSYKAHVSNVKLVCTAEPGITLIGVPIKWSQVILNLVANGIDAYDDISDSIRIREVRVDVTEDTGYVTCIVSDRGSGIQKEHLEQIWKPFFTTKKGDDTKGTGIGLSMVKDILEKDFNGTISVMSNREEGTRFILKVPK